MKNKGEKTDIFPTIASTTEGLFSSLERTYPPRRTLTQELDSLFDFLAGPGMRWTIGNLMFNLFRLKDDTFKLPHLAVLHEALNRHVYFPTSYLDNVDSHLSTNGCSINFPTSRICCSTRSRSALSANLALQREEIATHLTAVARPTFVKPLLTILSALSASRYNSQGNENSAKCQKTHTGHQVYEFLELGGILCSFV
ncbi:hypothetical protein K503DRAFT_773728, partial [Rhizopogon vinicolor AM-OR11-026]